MKKSLLALSTSAPLLLAFVAGCSSDPDTFTAAKGASLIQAADCGDLLEQIQRDAIAKLDHQVGLYKRAIAEGEEYYGGFARSSPDVALGSATSGDDAGGVPESDGASAPSDPGAELGNGGSTSAGKGESEVADPDGHSETNTQVQGVHEADIVKISEDGKEIFVLHSTQLKKVDAWPADEMTELGSADVPGQAFEFFVHEGIATVFSTVYPQDLPAGSERESSGDYYYDEPGDYGCYYGGDSFTQISVFDVSGDTPQLEREMIFEGNYVSSRRHGDNVRAIVRGGFQAHDLYEPSFDAYDSFDRLKSDERLLEELEQWRDSVAADIRASELSDWVPRRFARDSGSWEELDAQCGSYFVPAPGLVEGGVTQVVTLDAGSGGDAQVTSVLGGSETVYANHTSLFVAQTDWQFEFSGDGEGQRSSIHKFELDGLKSNYLASGFIPGVMLNQFAMDEKDGVLRVTTTERKNWEDDPVNSVFTVGQDEAALVQIDRSEPLGEPGETIFSTRFVGDRAYVVTFLNTDPLYVLDMSDPTDIQIKGDLHIPGFSDYMHPVGDNILVTVGQDADLNGNTNGFALQMFDVSDATAPALIHKEAYGGYSSSIANHNHKAFTYKKDYFGEGRDLLLFPLVTYEPQYESVLEVVEVSRDDGFIRHGKIDHAPLINDCADFAENGNPCQYFYGEEMRRGHQIDDFIYALSQGGLTAHSIKDLDAEALSTVKMETPQYGSCSYGGGIDIGFPEPGIGPDIGESTGGSTGVEMGGSSGI